MHGHRNLKLAAVKLATVLGGRVGFVDSIVLVFLGSSRACTGT